jgi:ribosome-binding protein aMBF1 (putative translation factor)
VPKSLSVQAREAGDLAFREAGKDPTPQGWIQSAELYEAAAALNERLGERERATLQRGYAADYRRKAAAGEAATARWEQARAGQDPGPKPTETGAAHLGARLRWARISAGLTHRALAAKAGCSYTAVWAAEQGKSQPATALVEQWAAALEISPAWLAYGSK